jgi:hypothetical protein
MRPINGQQIGNVGFEGTAMSQAISSPPGPEYSDVTEFLTWVGDFLGDGHAQILWGPSNAAGSLFTFYSLPTTGGGRDYFQSSTDQEPQIHAEDLKLNSVGWVGAFADAPHSSVLFYDVMTDDWWLLRGQPTGGVPKFSATKVGNTLGFGHAINDGRPFWTGDFDGDGLDEVLFYFPGDGAWWLGNIASNQLTWTHVGTTPFSTIGAGYRTWSGRFTQTHQSEVLFALASGYWLLFTMSGSQLMSHGMGNTSGFGPMNDGRPFWVGNFAGDGIDEMLFYHPADDNWWMARFVPGASENPACAQLRKNIADTKIAITELQAEQIQANIDHDHAALTVLSKELTAANTQLASQQAQLAQAGCPATPPPPAFGQLVWQLVGNTIGYGHGLTSDGRPFWVGRFSQTNQDEILFYFAALGHWHRGILSGNTMQWTLAGTTNLSLGLYLFSNQAGHAWAGDFDGDGLTELVYRVTNSPNFWMFHFSATAVTGSQVYTPPSHTTTQKVPNVVGSSLAMATIAISGESLIPDAYALDGNNNIIGQFVVAQDPVGGVTVQQGAHVNLGCIAPSTGVKTLNFFNCSNHRLHLWTSTDGDQTWNDEGSVDPPTDAGASNCPSKAVNFSKQGTVDFVAVDAVSFPDVAPDDSDFDAASMVFRAAIPGSPGGIEITASKSS